MYVSDLKMRARPVKYTQVWNGFDLGRTSRRRLKCEATDRFGVVVDMRLTGRLSAYRAQQLDHASVRKPLRRRTAARVKGSSVYGACFC